MRPKQLRDLSRLYQEAARNADAPTKRQLAVHAAALTQAAEDIERLNGGDDIANGDAARHLEIAHRRSTVVEALSEPVRHSVRTLLSEPEAGAPGQGPIRTWRRQAQELRMMAEQFKVPSAQEGLRRAAANYDQLADNADALLRWSPPLLSDNAG